MIYITQLSTKDYRLMIGEYLPLIKTLGKVLTMVITGVIFTFSLTGCIPAGSHSQSEVSQSEVSQLEVS